MDEENKPFPIELVVILLIVAVANDIAEIFFDFLDFTGVGVAGEAIMEPANFVLDFFFTGVFVWKLGFGGGTVTQYIGDLLEPFLIPARTISVGIGIWVANHPSSAVGKVAGEVSSLESGDIEGAAESEAKNAASAVESETATRKSPQEESGEPNSASASSNTQTATEEKRTTGASSSEPEEENDDGKIKESDETEDISASPEEKNPMENLQKELEEPQEGASKASDSSGESDEESGPQTKVVDIRSSKRHRPSSSSEDEDSIAA